MTEKTDGPPKAFYENIVSKHKRSAKPPKAGKEGSEHAGRERGSDSDRPRAEGSRDGAYRTPRAEGSRDSAHRAPRPEGPRNGAPRYPRAEGSRDGAPRYPRAEGPRDGAPRYPRAEGPRDGAPRYPRAEGPRDGAPRYPRPEGSRDGAPRYPRPEGSRDGAPRYPRPEGPRDGAPRYPRPENSRDASGRAPRRDISRGSRPDQDSRFSRSEGQRDVESKFAQEELRREREGNAAPTDDRRDGESRAPRKPFAAPAEFTPVFGTLPAEVKELLEAFPAIVDAVFPLDSKRLQNLSTEIRDLSHELTDERGERRVGYMNEPAVLSAYIRYYMWWNLVRLSRLFVSMPIKLEDGDVAVDLGSGPLTLPIALWMTRPDLRDKKITWYCVDISQGALAAGEELFLSLAARTGNEPWQIVRIKGECGVSLRRRVALVASANMFNELFWDNPLPLEAQAKHHAEEISSYADSEASILVVEPGVPRAGRFISLLRDALLRLGFAPVAPCPHAGICPFPGLRYGKWCHFVFDTADAPAKLHKLSDDAGLAKDRAALSFILAHRNASSAVADETDSTDVPAQSPVAETGTATEMLSRMTELFPPLKVRITSDPIKLPDFFTGRYGCSEVGMVMVTGTYQAADYLKTCHSGSLIEVPMPDRKRPERDPKTDAILVRLK